MRPASFAVLAAVTALALAGAALDASALSRACINSPTPTPGPLPLPLVTGTLGFVLSGGCISGLDYHVSTAPPCPGIGAQPGEYCGPVIPPLGQATCTWFPVFNSVPTGLYAGFDVSGDGNVLDPSGETVEGPIPAFPGGAVLTNPFSAPARIIAYPTNLLNQLQFPADLNLVTCV